MDRSDRGSLEGLCSEGDWVRAQGPIDGIELLRARFSGPAFARHRHDTYAIGVTETGVQTFDYRGRVERSCPGEVFVLHPDEMHDGRAGHGQWVWLSPDLCRPGAHRGRRAV